MKKMLFTLVTFLSMSISAFAAVNINTATQAELESLKNVGSVKAQAIIDYRKKNGGFKSVEDLNNVPGIGDKTMETLKGEISVSGATTVAAPVAAKDAKPAKADKKAKPAEATAPAAKAATVDAKPADTAKTDKAAAKEAAKAEKEAAKAKAKADKEAAKAEKEAAKAKEKADKAAAKEAAKAAKAEKVPATDAKAK